MPVQVPEDVRKVYCRFIVGADADDTLSDLAVVQLARVACANWQVLPLFRSWLAVQPQLEERICALAEWAVDAATSVAAYSRVHLRCQLEITAALAGAGIDACLLKSAASRLFYYQDPVHRCGWDVDLAVRREETAPVEELLQELGYVPAVWVPTEGHFRSADMAKRKAVEAQHYELGFYARRNQVLDLTEHELAAVRRCQAELPHWHECGPHFCCYVTADVHHAVSLDIGLEQLLEGAVVRSYKNCQVKTPNPAWCLLHLIFKVYWEAGHSPKPALYQFADIHRISMTFSASDAGELREHILRFGLGVAFLWVMGRLRHDFGARLPSELASLIEELNQLGQNDMAFSRTNNIGDVWANLWSVAAHPDAADT